MDLSRRRFLGFLSTGTAQVVANGAGIPTETGVLLDEAKANGRRKAQEAWEAALNIARSYDDTAIRVLCDPTCVAYSTGEPQTHHRDVISAAYDSCAEACRAAQEAVIEYEKRFSSPLTWRELIPEESEYARLMLEIRNIQPDSTIDVTELTPWMQYNHQILLRRAEHFDALTQGARHLVKKSVQAGNTECNAQRLIHDTLAHANQHYGFGGYNNLDSSDALREVETLSSSMQSQGDRFVQETITRETQEAKRATQYIEERVQSEIKRSKEFGNALESVGKDKVFFQLSHNKSTAEHKFKLIQELIRIPNGTYSFDNVPVVMRSDIRVEDITLPNDENWPDDRYVPVPTQKYEHVWGVELNSEQFHRLTYLSREYPNIVAELQLSEFSNVPTTQAHR